MILCTCHMIYTCMCMRHDVFVPTFWYLQACACDISILFLNLLWASDVQGCWKLWSKLVQAMACCLTAPSHYLNQCWQINSVFIGHLPEGNFTGNAQDHSPWYGVENYQFKTQAYLTGAIELTHWGRVTHIFVIKLTIIGSDNGLLPDRHQAIIWTNAGLLLIGRWGTNFSEILIEILTFSFKKMRLKVSSAKRRPFCLSLNVLKQPMLGLVQYCCAFMSLMLMGC